MGGSKVLLSESLSSLKGREIDVYQYVSMHVREVPAMTIRELAAATGVSTSTVLRFCRKLGCRGWREFKYRLSREREPGEPLRDADGSTLTMMASVPYVIQFFQRAASDVVMQRTLDRIAGWCRRAPIVVVAGLDLEEGLAMHGARQLEQRGVIALALTSSPYRGLEGPALDGCVLLALSAHDESADLAHLISGFKARGARTVAVTNTGTSPLARIADASLACHMPLDDVTYMPLLFFVEEIANRLTAV